MSDDVRAELVGPLRGWPARWRLLTKRDALTIGQKCKICDIDRGTNPGTICDQHYGLIVREHAELQSELEQSEARYESLVSQIRALPRFDCDGYLESTASPDGANVRWADLLALVDHP